MTLLAIGVSAYAFAYVGIPEFNMSAFKQRLMSAPVAMWSHLLGGGVALLLGTFQVYPPIRNRFIGWHRTLGKVYLLAILFGGLGGLYMSWFSTGGWITHVGFGLLAIGWLYTGAMAYTSIRKGDVPAHRAWMIRNYALTLAAVTLRIYLPISQIAGIEFIPAYQAISWLCWVPNLIVAEWVFVRGLSRPSATLSFNP